MTIRWSERARRQVRAIVRYIARDRPQTSEQFLEGLLERVTLLATFPDQGPVWEESGRPDVRSIIYESHRILYRVRKDEIAILSVRHTGRLPPEDVDK